MSNIFFELTLLFIVAGAVAVVVSFFKQPGILAYILTGLVLGPFGYYKLTQGELLGGLSEIGITLLLFMIGLELDLSELKRIGRTAVFAGLGQIVFTALIGFIILKTLGFASVPAWYIALALTFSSTIIVVKLLSEKKDLQSLYGKITVGVFLMQDFVALFVLIALTGASRASLPIYSGLAIWEVIFITIVKALFLGLLAFWNSKYLFPKLMPFVGKSQELLLIFSLAWALGLAALVALPIIGFSIEIGGFLAGLSLANSSVHYEISAKIRSLRDFFIILFFIALGSQLVLTNFASIAAPAIILSLFVLIGNPLILLVLLGVLGYKPRTAFFSSVTVAQISEFSFILIALGKNFGQLDQSVVSLVTLVGLITMTFSSYMILYSDKIYKFLRPAVELFDFRKGLAEKHVKDETLANHIVVVGAHRLGSHIINTLFTQEQKFVVIDHNPEITEHYANKGISTICGDISDDYIQELANLPKAKAIISTVPDLRDNLSLIENAQKLKRHVHLIIAAEDEEEARYLYSLGVDYAILPHFIGGEHLAKILETDHKFKELRRLRQEHLKVLGQVA